MMTPEARDKALASIEEAYRVRQIMRNTYCYHDGPAALLMLWLESTALSTDAKDINPSMAAHFNQMLYNLGILHPKNYVRLVDALIGLSNDDDLDAEKAEVNQEETE